MRIITQIHRFSLRTNRKGATLMELMAMLLVVSLALTAFFYTLSQSLVFARDAEARIKAVALAREGVEAMYNIRNTNWLRFSSSRTKCWDSLNYDPMCLNGANGNKIENGSYILYSENGLWKLESTTAGDWGSGFTASATRFQIGITKDGWYTGKNGYDQSKSCVNIGNSSGSFRDCRSIFSREVQIKEKTETTMKAEVSVHWFNERPRSVSLVADVTNWKSLYEK